MTIQMIPITMSDIQERRTRTSLSNIDPEVLSILLLRKAQTGVSISVQVNTLLKSVLLPDDTIWHIQNVPPDLTRAIRDYALSQEKSFEEEIISATTEIYG